MPHRRATRPAALTNGRPFRRDGKVEFGGEHYRLSKGLAYAVEPRRNYLGGRRELLA